MDYLEYKGYKGTVEYSKEDDCFCGKVLGIDKDLIAYEGRSVSELRADFEAGVDSYLEGRCDERTTSGKLFRECVAEVPDELKLEVDWSDAIAEKICKQLSEQGLSQKAFAKRMGKTEAEVSRWLSGTHNFTLRTISKISTVLGINMIQI